MLHRMFSKVNVGEIQAHLLLWGLILFCAGCQQHTESTLAVGDSFPEIQLTDFEGNRLDFGELGSRVIVINIWATWCRPCRDEMPGLSELASRLDPERFLVIGISIDEDRYLAVEFLRGLHIGFQNYHDPEQQVVRDQLNNQALPETLIVSAEGILKLRLLGERDWLDPAAMEMLGNLAADRDPVYE